MQNDEIHRARVVAEFLIVARRYLGLGAAPADAAPIRPAHSLGQLRPMLRSLLIVGSLGTVLSQPALAVDRGCPASEPEQAEMTPSCEADSRPGPDVSPLQQKSAQN